MAIIRRIDTDGDACLDFGEFTEFFKYYYHTKAFSILSDDCSALVVGTRVRALLSAAEFLRVWSRDERGAGGPVQKGPNS